MDRAPPFGAGAGAGLEFVALGPGAGAEDDSPLPAIKVAEIPLEFVQIAGTGAGGPFVSLIAAH